MIDRSEIDAKALEFQIHPTNVERDYVFGWLLMGIYTTSSLGRVLILKGGNGFRKAYFSTARFSKDLDFATQTSVDEQFLRREFLAVCAFIEERAAVRFAPERLRVEMERHIDEKRRKFDVHVYFQDFYGKPGTVTVGVSVDIVEFDRLYLPTQGRQLIHPYSDAAACTGIVRCVKLEEMLANKLKCLLQRKHIADLYDLAYSVLINQDIAIDRTELVRTFLRKTIFEPSPDVAKTLFLALPLHLLKDAWTRYVLCPIQSTIDWDGALGAFRDLIEGLFAPYGTRRGFGALAFFPAELRQTIMDAGAGRRLLQLSYDGVTRTVEPYSLAFKRRKDGAGQEYLYVYDRTGGSSGPGIKSLVHTKIRNLTVLEQQYDARYPIDLSKAGEFFTKSYFTGGRRPGFHASRSRGPGSTLVYVYECAYCQRRFTRTTRRTALRPHHDKYGNACYGRRAILVDQRYR